MLPECDVERRSGFTKTTAFLFALLSLASLCQADEYNVEISKSSTHVKEPVSKSPTPVKELVSRVVFDSSQTFRPNKNPVCQCGPCEMTRLFYIIAAGTFVSGILFNLVCFYLLLRQKTNLILKNLPPKFPPPNSRRQSSLKPGVSTTESTTSSVLVKMLKGLKSSIQANSDYDNEMKMGSTSRPGHHVNVKYAFEK